MQKEQIKEKIDELIDELIKSLKEKLGNRLESIILTGSYAIGKISYDRPDVNLILFFKERFAPEDSIMLSKIFSRLVKKFKEEYVVRPEFRPFRFVYPRIRDKEKMEVFINPLILNMADINEEFPFNQGHYILAGMKKMGKVVFGSDPLIGIDLKITKERVVKNMFRIWWTYKIQIDRTPLAYDIEKDCDLFFNESLAMGKLISYDGIELVMTDEELKEEKYIEIVSEKEKLIKFYKKRYDEEAAKFLEIILNSRKNYLEWRNNERKAVELYKATSGIWQKIWLKLLEINEER